MNKKIKKYVIFVEIILIIVLLIPTSLNNYFPIKIIQSDSMEPNIKKNDIVFIQGWNKNFIKNETIAYYNPIKKKIIVHRVEKKVSQEKYITKGDNNPYNDSIRVSKNFIIGNVVFSIPTSILFENN